MKWIRKFMMGRYGVIDELSKLIFGIGITLTIFSMFFNSRILRFLATIFPIIFVYRTLSKNVRKRYGENARFLKSWNSAKRRARNKTKKIKGLKDYKYFKCINCDQNLRVPRGKGRVSITCPKCKTIMIKKS